MVGGHRFDEAAVTAFVDDAVVITIAHNSGFDRKFAERYWPVFERKAWGCSMSEIDFRGLPARLTAERRRLLSPVGPGGRRLSRTAGGSRLRIADHGSLLLETARKPTLRVWAEQTAFELKDSLKRRGYRWNDGSDGRPKSCS